MADGGGHCTILLTKPDCSSLYPYSLLYSPGALSCTSVKLPLTCVCWLVIRGLGQGHGFAQVVALIALEAITAISGCSPNAAASYFIAYFPGLFYWHPYYSKGYNRVNYLLQTIKVISHALLILFVPSLNFNVSSSQLHYLAYIHGTVAHLNHYHRHSSPCSAFDCCTNLGCFNHCKDGYELVLVLIS